MGAGRVMSAAAACVLCGLLTAACMQQPQQQPEPSRSEIRGIVQEELDSPRMQEQIMLAIQGQGLQPMIEQALRSPETEKLITETMVKNMQSPDVQKQLELTVEKLLDAPELTRKIREEVKTALMMILQGGGQDGQDGGGGGRDGQGGGSVGDS